MRWFSFIAFIFFLSCGNPSDQSGQQANEAIVQEGKKLLKPGDLVLRAGTSYASNQIKELSVHEKFYSHVGIVVPVDSGMRICSIEPIDETSKTDKIRYDDVETFLDPKQNAAFAIYRYNLNLEETLMLTLYVQGYYAKKIAFDPEFKYETDNKMYCSELISKALDSATKGRIELERSYITNPSAINSIVRHFKKYKLTAKQIKNRPVVLIENVYRHPECRLIKKFNFQ
jgi:hypothetical protein